MSTARIDLGAKLASIKASFDRTFAYPLPVACTGRVRLLAIRVASEPFALRIAAVTAIARDRKIVHLSGGVPGFRGLVGARGRLLVVYSLAALLGYVRKDETERWLAQSGSHPSVGLSFDHFEGHLEVDPQALHGAPLDKAPYEHVSEVLEEGSNVRGVVNVSSILKAIEHAVGVGTEIRSTGR